MIGAFLAAYFIGKANVMKSLIFWVILLIIGWILAAYSFGEGSIVGLLVNLIIGIIIFIALAVFYLRVNLKTAGIMYIFSLIVNIAIGYISGVAFGLAQYTLTVI